MTIASVAFERWWRSAKTLGPANAWANIGVGLACALCVVFDVRIGLGSFAPAFLAYFAVLSVVWGLVALRFGGDPKTARPLRLTGDILAWIALVGFSLLGLFSAETRETGALVTLLVFTVVTVVVASPGIRSDLRGGR